MRNSYYENWFNGLITLLMEKGLITQSELDSGAVNLSEPLSTAAVLQAAMSKQRCLKGGPVNMEVDQAPRFLIGDSVQVLNINPEGHTRLRGMHGGKQVSWTIITARMCTRTVRRRGYVKTAPLQCEFFCLQSCGARTIRMISG